MLNISGVTQVGICMFEFCLAIVGLTRFCVHGMQCFKRHKKLHWRLATSESSRSIRQAKRLFGVGWDGGAYCQGGLFL